MLVRVTKFAGTSLAIAGIQAVVLNPGSMPNAQPVFIPQAQADQVYSGTYDVALRSIALQIQITNYADRYALMSTIKGLFKRGTRGDLEATFGDDGLDYRLDCVVVTPPVQDQDFPWYFTVILQTGDSAWRAVAQETQNWDPTGTGGTQEITVGGNDETRLSLDITPTTGPATGVLYKKLYQLVNVVGRNFGTRAWCLSIDHAALVTAGKSQADGDDLRIWLGEVETKRWISGADTATCKIWFNAPIPAGRTIKLLTAVPASGAISILQFVKNDNSKNAIAAMPSKGVVYNGNEWFYYGGKNAAKWQLTNITRAIYGTTEEAHAGAVNFSFIAQSVFLLYGNSTIGAPSLDDDNYDDDKPVFNLTDSDNTKWVYDATTKYFDPDHPARQGSWIQTIVRKALNLDTYLYNVKEDAETGDPALGARAANFISGSTWKADTITLAWQFPVCAATLYRITATGRKYRSSSLWPTARMQQSADGTTWTNLWTEAKPSAEDTFEAWAAHTNVAFASGKLYLRQIFSGAFGASPSDSYALLEGLTTTVEFVSANLPAGTLLAEQDNAQLTATITNNNNGDQVIIDLPMKLNLLLAMDGETNIVLFDGANAYRALSLDDESRSVWIRLETGINEIEISGVDIGTLDIDLKWYRRRLH